MTNQSQERFSLAGLPISMSSPGAVFKVGGPKFLRDFKEFALRGSVLDMAVGIVLGVAFGRIVTSFVDDILMPPLGMLLGHVDAANLFVSLTGKHFDTLAAAKAAAAPTLNYGVFLNNIFNFLLVAFAIFVLVRQVNRFRRSQDAPAPTTKECPYCLSAVPLKATRCPHCTSQLGTAPAPAG
ncbi:MAG TPA: large conductance mechanosensitive channel protein MscL [Terriglobales bacterium]|nr:large conductance mechanosensitive channel protein MscL [Terriglobales bacterium]